MELIDTVVIGGGPAGVCASRVLQRAGHAHVVLERGRVFEAWRSRRWDGFKLNTTMDQSRLVDQEDGHADDEIGVPLIETLKLWDDLVAQFKLPVLEGHAVESVSEKEGGDTLLVSTRKDNGEVVMFEAKNVICAPGVYQYAAVPEGSQDVSSTITQVAIGGGCGPDAVAAYTNSAALPPGAVLVVGTGQSGAQVAHELLAAGRRVSLCASGAPGCPRTIRGRDVFTWIGAIGMQMQPKESLEDVAAERIKHPPVAGPDYAVSLFSLARSGADIYGRLVGCKVGSGGKVLELRDDLAASLQTHKAGYDGLLTALLGAAASRPEASDLSEHAPEPEWEPYQPLIHRSASGCPTELDLAAAGITSIVWATGWRTDFSWMRVPAVNNALDVNGFPDDVSTPHAGVFWLGFPWLRTRGSNLIVGFERDATAILDKLR